MAKEMRQLFSQTVIYGASSIVGRFLNWLLVPLYTFVLTSSADYGVVTNLYAWTALLLVILTYGMETGLFRFAGKEPEKSAEIYGNTLICVGTTSAVFAAVCLIFSPQFADLLGYSAHAEFVALMGVIVALDAFGSIPFAFLRFQKKAAKFAILKLAMIFINIGFNLFFLLLCPWLEKVAPQTVSWFYNPDYGVGYIFVSNLFSTIFVTIFLLGEMRQAKFKFDKILIKKMLRYSLPLLVLGITGIMNQTVDKILFPFLFADKTLAAHELGIYGACFKIAMIMMMFTQAFRYAYEPFIFAKFKDKNSVASYAEAMKFFIIFSWLIFLGMVFYLDIFKFLIRADYWVGLKIIPVVLISYIFQGAYFNLSLWYKLSDQTHWGAYLSAFGVVITLAVNIIFVPKFSYMASAYASLLCNFSMMLLSYFLGKKRFPVPYDLKKIGVYSFLALAMFSLTFAINFNSKIADFAFKTVLLFLFVFYIFKKDLPLNSLPVVGKFFRKKL